MHNGSSGDELRKHPNLKHFFTVENQGFFVIDSIFLHDVFKTLSLLILIK